MRWIKTTEAANLSELRSEACSKKNRIAGKGLAISASGPPFVGEIFQDCFRG
jgi:hypothetical protein